MMLNFQEKMPFEIFNIVDMSIQMQMIPFFEKKQYEKVLYTPCKNWMIFLSLRFYVKSILLMAEF